MLPLLACRGVPIGAGRLIKIQSKNIVLGAVAAGCVPRLLRSSQSGIFPVFAERGAIDALFGSGFFFKPPFLFTVSCQT